jgi:transcriptional regulator
MYIPPAFKVEDYEKLAKFIGENSFATLVTQAGGTPFASHVPLLLDTETGPPGRLLGHVARANPQWTHFASQTEILAVFHGPHAYISPSWYAAKVAVPTWNYVAVHAYGIPKIIEEAGTRERLLEMTIQKYEAGRPNPWQNSLPADFKAVMAAAIVAFEVRLTRLEGKFKLGQNRSQDDLKGVYAALSQSVSADDRKLAEVMQEEGLTG